MLHMSKINIARIASLLGVCAFCIGSLPHVALSDHCAPGMIHDPQNPQTCVIESKTPGVPVTTPTGQTLSNDGIYGCRGLGAQVANVGTLSAIGGIYVPVNDAAVTLNTGFLVYKECILDGVTRKIAENISAEYTATQLRAFNAGRGGNPQYLVNFDLDLTPPMIGVVVADIQRMNQSAMCQAFKGTVQNALARNYARTFNNPTSIYSCPFPAASSQQNQGFTYGNWFNTIRPSGNVFGATAVTQAQINADLAKYDRNIRQMLDWGNGVFPLTDNTEDPLAERVLTPGYIIAQSVGQVIGSGFRQLETANEIDQVVGNLFGGLTTQLVADTRGLIGLTQSLNGQPSYLDRMTSQTGANVRQQATNAALAVISAARQIELTYRQAKEGIATALTNAIQQLRSAENQCWGLIIPAVQTYAQANGNPTLNIATSTQFSQQIIDSQIAPLATTTINDIRASDATIAILNQLIASVTNSASQANQQQALLRLDTMVANRQLHTAADATNAATQRDNVVSAVGTLVTDTIKSWGDSTDSNIGWCNINNTAVVERWFNAWRQ